MAGLLHVCHERLSGTRSDFLILTAPEIQVQRNRFEPWRVAVLLAGSATPKACRLAHKRRPRMVYSNWGGMCSMTATKKRVNSWNIVFGKAVCQLPISRLATIRTLQYDSDHLFLRISLNDCNNTLTSQSKMPMLLRHASLLMFLCLAACGESKHSVTSTESVPTKEVEQYVRRVTELRPLAKVAEAFQRTAGQDLMDAGKTYSNCGLEHFMKKLNPELVKLIQISVGCSASLTFCGETPKPIVVFYHPLTDLVFSTQWSLESLKMEAFSFSMGNVIVGEPGFTPLSGIVKDANVLRRSQLAMGRLAARLLTMYPVDKGTDVAPGMPLMDLLTHLRISVAASMSGMAAINQEETVKAQLLEWLDGSVLDKVEAYSSPSRNGASPALQELPYECWHDLQIVWVGKLSKGQTLGYAALVCPREKPWVWILLKADVNAAFQPVDAACINL